MSEVVRRSVKNDDSSRVFCEEISTESRKVLDAYGVERPTHLGRGRMGFDIAGSDIIVRTEWEAGVPLYTFYDFPGGEVLRQTNRGQNVIDRVK